MRPAIGPGTPSAVANGWPSDGLTRRNGGLPRSQLLLARSLCHKALVLKPACSLSGLRRGRPRLPPTCGTASSSSSNGTLSWTLAPVKANASGMPRRSVIRWRLVPGLPRSVGFGPVAAPLFWRRWKGTLNRRHAPLTTWAGFSRIPFPHILRKDQAGGMYCDSPVQLEV